MSWPIVRQLCEEKKKRKIFDDVFSYTKIVFGGHFPTLVKDSWSLFGASISWHYHLGS